MYHIKRFRNSGGIVKAVVIILILMSLFLLMRTGRERVPTAVSKGGPQLNETTWLETAVDQAAAREMALADEGVESLLAGKDYGFLSALPLTGLESQRRADSGCAGDGTDTACARVSFYNYSEGGTVEAVVNLETGQVLESKVHPDARPGANSQVLPRALAIAAADSRVTDVVGDVRQAEPVMGPMAGWLLDDDCLEDWCVDLTYAAPDGSGRTFHVFVNMEQEKVARVFYSRSRAERTAAIPPAQERVWDNGCHEAYGWNVCWEMTANDGVEFQNATFNGDSIFSSIKIGQIEVYYPSWPGGYRDEVGYLASVAPAGGTPITDLGDGFEVRQLFTEFLAWPNCVCCYRYEEIIRFYADGTLGLHFISHGPGCDDPMIYRTFWRIDLDLDGEANEELLVWENNEWAEAAQERRIEVFENLSPEGELLITGGGDYRYRWLPLKSDPDGLDEALIFLLRWNEDEGEGEIVAGEANTFRPPGQWLTDEPLTNEDIVVWYVSILKGRKGGPWWCAPEPAPDFSPCDAEIRIEPIAEVASEATATTEETAVAAVTETATATITPQVPPTLAATATPQLLAATTVEGILQISGCDNCHLMGDLGEAGKVGPDLSSIGILAAERVPGQSAEEYLRTSIINPEAFLAGECPNGPCLGGIMPGDYGVRLTSEQIDTMVAFLLDQRAGGDPESGTGIEQPTSDGLSTEMTAVIIVVGLVLVGVLVFGVYRLRGRRGEGG